MMYVCMYEQKCIPPFCLYSYINIYTGKYAFVSILGDNDKNTSLQCVSVKNKINSYTLSRCL